MVDVISRFHQLRPTDSVLVTVGIHGEARDWFWGLWICPTVSMDVVHNLSINIARLSPNEAVKFLVGRGCPDFGMLYARATIGHAF
jgi:hypothetical protein